MAIATRSTIPKLNVYTKDLVKLSVTNFLNIDDALESCIQFGIDKIGFQAGAVSKIYGNEIQTPHIKNANKLLTNKRFIPLYNTFCKRVVETKVTLISKNFEDALLHNLPTYEVFDIETIICVPILISKKIFGSSTFCTIKANFKNQQQNCFDNKVKALGQLIGTFLKEQSDENELKTKTKYLKQFKNDLKTFAKIGATHYSSFSENLNAYINFGKKITGFDNTFIGEINNNIYIIREGSTTFCILNPSDIFKLSDTPCYKANKKKATVAYIKLKNSTYNSVLGSVAFNSEASIKQAQKKLQFKNAELAQLAYATTYNLQKLLKTITGYSNRLVDTCSDELPVTNQECFSYITDALNRMKKQIDGLLNHSRIGYRWQMELVNMNCTLCVKDNGIDISKENIGKIFNLFARLNKQSDFKSTGIGLNHCEKIVNLYNGEITVQSELGQELTLSFTIKK